jgi:hypothetical protein
MNLKVRYIASITVMIIGFISAQLTSGRVPSIVFYWIGFILYFGIQPISKTTFAWQKWGRRGLIVNIVLTAFLLLLLQIIRIYPSNSEYSFYGLRGLNFLLKPISHGVDLIFPNERLIMPDGSVQLKVSYVKSAFTNLLDVMVFIAAGVIVGRYASPKSCRI